MTSYLHTSLTLHSLLVMKVLQQEKLENIYYNKKNEMHACVLKYNQVPQNNV